MYFASAVPWWLALVLVAAIGALTFAEYRRPLVPLTHVQRAVLSGCRALALCAIVLFVCRPVTLVSPSGGGGGIVPVLVDVSRSMRLRDADGLTRIERATTLLRDELLPALSRHFTPELYSVGERLEAAGLDRLSGDGRRSDLAGGLAAVRERYRGQRVAGIVLLSDGGDTGQSGTSAAGDVTMPVFAVGLGTADRIRDRGIVAVTAGEQRLDQATVDLRVSAVSSGFGRAPLQIRLLDNGRELETRRVVPSADGAPIDETFTVSPDPAGPTVYTVEIPVDEAEEVAENNSRSVLINPAGAKRRLLIIEGAPGFEHSFMKRAWSSDTSLELDAVGRKGRNGDGQDTFFVQAATASAAALARGFPSRREDLYAYDGLVLANVEGDFLTRAQLATIADFVAERGGGLLVVGARSFAERGFAGTPLEELLPVELDTRRGALARTSAGSATAGGQNKVLVTREGEDHPIMRIGNSPEQTRRMWAALPALAASAPLGGARPGATVLAVASASTGATYPIIAVQRYGRGRSMIFSGEASWRWKMMLASTDRSYEFFWRQAARWIAGSSPGAISITVPEDAGIGDDVSIEVDILDTVFAPVSDAAVQGTVTGPGGETHSMALGRVDRAPGRYGAGVRAERPGVYRVDVDVLRGGASVGRAVRWWYVGGGDREFADPRLNEAWLRRVARQSGGRYLRPPDVARVVEWLQQAAPGPVAPQRRDAWHGPWAFAGIVALLSAEWILRRRWGLR